VLPGGADWTLLRSDGVLELDLLITLEADDGALIYMTSFGLRHGQPEVLAALARGRRGRSFSILLSDSPEVRNERAAVRVLESIDRNLMGRSQGWRTDLCD